MGPNEPRHALENHRWVCACVCVRARMRALLCAQVPEIPGHQYNTAQHTLTRTRTRAHTHTGRNFGGKFYGYVNTGRAPDEGPCCAGAYTHARARMRVRARTVRIKFY